MCIYVYIHTYMYVYIYIFKISNLGLSEFGRKTALHKVRMWPPGPGQASCSMHSAKYAED